MYSGRPHEITSCSTLTFTSAKCGVYALHQCEEEKMHTTMHTHVHYMATPNVGSYIHRYMCEYTYML